MRLQIRGSSWLTAGLLVVPLTATIRGQSEPQLRDVPPRRALDLAVRLARKGVTAGVVMCYWLPRPDGQRPEDDVAATDEARRSCEELNASLFQRLEGGVLHVRTTKEPHRVTELLNRRVQLDPAAGIPAVEILGRLVNAVRGVGGVGTGSSSADALTQPVAIRGGSTTFMEALDDVVRQAPGLVWHVTFAPEDGSSFVIVSLVDGRSLGMGIGVFPGPKRRCAPSCGP